MNRWNGCLGISAVIFLAVFLSTVLLAGNGHGNPVVDGTPGAVPPCMADEVVESRIPVSPRVIDDAVGTRHAVSPRATVEVAESQTPMSPHSQPTQSPNADKPSPQILDTQSQTQNPPLNPPSAGNTPADHPEIVQKMQKLQMPFIANEGQVDECVAFYAKTFGGTVFVTKNGEIVYSLPSGRDVPAGASQESCRDTARRVPTSPIQYLAYVMHSSKGDVLGRIPEKRESRIMDYVSWFGGCAPDGRLMGLPVTDSTRGRDTVPRVPTVNLFDDTAGRVAATAARRDTVCRVPARSTGVALKEEFIGAKISGIKGEGESVTKVSYFKGNDPSKWKSNISTYQLVNLGEIYEGVELKLKAHGNNVEKLLYVKPGADIEQIKIRLSGIQPAETPMMEGKQPPESPFIKGDCAESTFGKGEGRRPGGDVSTKSPLKKGARGLSVNEHGELEAETASGTVAFTRPIAYQEIDGKRVEVACGYTIAECVENLEFGFWIVFPIPHSEFLNQQLPIPLIQNPQSKFQNRNTASPSPPTTKQKTSSSTPCWHPRSWAVLVFGVEVILPPSTQAGTYM